MDKQAYKEHLSKLLLKSKQATSKSDLEKIKAEIEGLRKEYYQASMSELLAKKSENKGIRR